ncbi:unnamed protein product [Ilex paraguariensis]|uniref:Uncharacterized protein n=1 Tax=Ilex paraguariensis TaxID=185542 RepID=A0ABC8SEJ1_9AQUA
MLPLLQSRVDNMLNDAALPQGVDVEPLEFSVDDCLYGDLVYDMAEETRGSPKQWGLKRLLQMRHNNVVPNVAAQMSDEMVLNTVQMFDHMWILCKMYEKAASKANREQRHGDNEGVVLLPNANAQPVLVQDPQFPPLPPTTFYTMSSAMLTYPRYGYGSGVPTDGVALPNGLNVGYPLLLDDISDYLASLDSLVRDDDDMMSALSSNTTHPELSSDDNKGGPS